MTVFQDLHQLPEDERITLIGHYVMQHRCSVAVVVDDEPAKVERYISKIMELSPQLVIEQGPSPVAKTVVLRVSLRADGVA